MLSQNNVKPSFINLFRTFFWLGLTAFGGVAMSAHVRKHIVDKKKWLDGSTFDSGLALCQVIPGAIIMQLAAYIGLKLKGISGAIVCFIGFGLPAFLIMFILISYIQTFQKHFGSGNSIKRVKGNNHGYCCQCCLYVW